MHPTVQQQDVGLEDVFQPLYTHLAAAERLSLFHCNRRLAQLVLQHSERTKLDLDCPAWPLICWAHRASNMTAMRLASHAPNVALSMANGLLPPPKQLLPHIIMLAIHAAKVKHSSLRALQCRAMPCLRHVALRDCEFPHGDGCESIGAFYLMLIVLGVGCPLIFIKHGLQAFLIWLGLCLSVIFGIIDPYRTYSCIAHDDRPCRGSVWAAIYGFVCTAVCYFSLFFLFSYCTNRTVWAACTPVVVAVWGVALATETYRPRAPIFPVPRLDWVGIWPEDPGSIATALSMVDGVKLVHLTTDDVRVCDHLAKLPALQKLHLTCSGVSKEALQKLQTHPALTDVRLGRGRGVRVIIAPTQHAVADIV